MRSLRLKLSLKCWLQACTDNPKSTHDMTTYSQCLIKTLVDDDPFERWLAFASRFSSCISSYFLPAFQSACPRSLNLYIACHGPGVRLCPGHRSRTKTQARPSKAEVQEQKEARKQVSRRSPASHLLVGWERRALSPHARCSTLSWHMGECFSCSIHTWNPRFWCLNSYCP